jgi:hypothetical protein
MGIYSTSAEIYSDAVQCATKYQQLTGDHSICVAKDFPNKTQAQSKVTNYLRIPDNALPDDKIGFLVLGGMLGNELMAPDALINFANLYLTSLVPYIKSNRVIPPNPIVIGGFTLTPIDIENIYNTIDLYIAPLINAEGRDYYLSYKLTTPKEIVGRKNRNTTQASIFGDSELKGVCVNRNFPIGWDFEKLFNTSCANNWKHLRDPMDKDYAGSSAASEHETQNVMSLFTDYANITYMFDIHGQSGAGMSWISYPWGLENNQNTDPSQCIENSKWDGKRDGPSANAYKEYMPAEADHITLGNEFFAGALGCNPATLFTNNQPDTNNPKGNPFAPHKIVAPSSISFPSPGTVDDYTYNLDKGRMRAFTVEFADLQPNATLNATEKLEVAAGLFSTMKYIADQVISKGSIVSMVRQIPPSIPCINEPAIVPIPPTMIPPVIPPVIPTLPLINPPHK